MQEPDLTHQFYCAFPAPGFIVDLGVRLSALAAVALKRGGLNRAPQEPLMGCPECERLEDEEREAAVRYMAAENALRTATEARDIFGPAEVDEWKALDAKVDTARQELQRAKRRFSVHQATHG